MKKKLLLFLVFLTGATGMNAQVFWSEVATGFTAASRGINQVSYADANNIWCTAYDGITTTNVIREYTRSNDGGDTWTPGVINLGSTTLGIGCIAGTSGTDAYVAAFPDTGGLGGIWKTANGGTTWTKQATASFNATASFTNVVYFWDANNGFCMGDPDTPTTFEIYTTTNGGTNWVRVSASNVPVPLDGEYGYTRSFAANGNAIWFGTNKGRMYRSFDKGLTWAVSQTPIADMQTGNYAFADVNNGLLITDDWQFFRTTDSRATWVSEFPIGTYRNAAVTNVPGVNGCAYVSLGEDIDLGERGSSYTTDGGLNWIDVNGQDDTNADNGSDVSFFDGGHGLAAGFNTSSTVGGAFKYVGSASLFDCTLATTSYTTAKTFTASPNPTSGVLNLNGKSISNVTVYDAVGKEVANKNYSALSNVTFDFSSFNNGVYMVKVTNAAGKSDTIKVVKQ